MLANGRKSDVWKSRRRSPLLFTTQLFVISCLLLLAVIGCGIIYLLVTFFIQVSQVKLSPQLTPKANETWACDYSARSCRPVRTITY